MAVVASVQRRLCVNNLAVPVEEHTLDCMDPYQEGQGDEESLKVLLVHLKASGNMEWLCKGMGLPARWWVHNHHRVPLMCEILELIKKKRPTQGAQRLLPRQASSIMPLRIRGKVLWFQNQVRFVVLALRTGQESPDLQQFLEELQKDVEILLENEADPGRSHKQKKVEVPDEEQEVVQRALNLLEEHSSCKSAKYFPSRKVFQVILQDKSCAEFGVKDLNKKRQEALKQEGIGCIETAYDKAMSAALNFLDGTEPLQLPLQQDGEPAASSEPVPVTNT